MGNEYLAIAFNYLKKEIRVFTNFAEYLNGEKSLSKESLHILREHFGESVCSLNRRIGTKFNGKIETRDTLVCKLNECEKKIERLEKYSEEEIKKCGKKQYSKMLAGERAYFEDLEVQSLYLFFIETLMEDAVESLPSLCELKDEVVAIIAPDTYCIFSDNTIRPILNFDNAIAFGDKVDKVPNGAKSVLRKNITVGRWSWMYTFQESEDTLRRFVNKWKAENGLTKK